MDPGFARFEAWRDEVLDEEEIERHKLDRKIAPRKTGCVTVSPAGASATSAARRLAAAEERRD